MADEVVVRKEIIPPPPEGQHKAVCVDVIDMGEKLDTYMGKMEITPRVVIVFQIAAVNPKTGRRFEIAIEKVVSFGTKAGLRKFLEGWRGKAYSPEQAEAGVPLHKLVANCALLTVEHKTSGAGNVYANITNAVPLPSEMATLTAHNYERAPYYAERKVEWAKAVQKHRDDEEWRQTPRDPEEVLAAGDDDDSLPF